MTASVDTPLAIVCAYPDGRLANAWFRAYKRVKRSMRHRGLNAQVALHPVTDLPARVDVLVVPPALVDVARGSARGVETVVASADGVQRAVDRIVERLVAEARVGYADPRPRTTAVHVGVVPLTERARATE